MLKGTVNGIVLVANIVKLTVYAPSLHCESMCQLEPPSSTYTCSCCYLTQSTESDSSYVETSVTSVLQVEPYDSGM